MLDIIGLPNAERVSRFAEFINKDISIDSIEAGAAKEYFAALCPDINRREETPMNSRLNYGYSIIRNSIIDKVFLCFIDNFGIGLFKAGFDAFAG